MRFFSFPGTLHVPRIVATVFVILPRVILRDMVVVVISSSLSSFRRRGGVVPSRTSNRDDEEEDPPPVLVLVLLVFLFLHDGARALLSTRLDSRGALERAFTLNAFSSSFSIISTIAISLRVWVGCHVHVHRRRRSRPLQHHPPCRSCLARARSSLRTLICKAPSNAHSHRTRRPSCSPSSPPSPSPSAFGLVVTLIVIARPINCEVIPPAVPVHRRTLSVVVVVNVVVVVD